MFDYACDNLANLYKWIAVLSFFLGAGVGSWLGFLVGVHYVEAEDE